MAVTRTPTVDNPGTVSVAVSRSQFLHFTVTAAGPIPIFTFEAKSNEREASAFPGHPETIYEWDHLRDSSQQEQLGLVAILLSFFSNNSYKYKVDVRQPDGAVVRTAMEIRFTGDPTDTAPESFNVVLT